MAKFKVGDKVKVKGSTKIGTISRINTNFGFDYYWVDGLSDGKNPPVYGESLLSLANSAPRSSNPVVANALAARNATVATNARLTYQQAVSMAKDAIKKMKDINAKVKPWREQMKQMRKTWDSIDVDFFYNIDKDGLDENQKSNIESLYKEFERVRQDGYYNFYSV